MRTISSKSEYSEGKPVSQMCCLTKSMSEVHDLCVPHWGKQKGVTVLASNIGICQDWRQLLGLVGSHLCPKCSSGYWETDQGNVMWRWPPELV